MKAYTLIAVLFLSGCAAFGEKPNNAAAFTSDQFYEVGKQVERAQSFGKISEETGDKYIDMLIRANDLFRGVSDIYADIGVCSTSETKYQCIDNILATIEEDIQ